MSRKLKIIGNRVYEERVVRDGFFGSYKLELITNPNDLLFPQRGRNYYKAGDYMGKTTITRQSAGRSYREFESDAEAELSPMSFVMSALELNQIEIVKKLDGVSNGTVHIKPFLKISDTEIVELTLRSTGRNYEVIHNTNLSSYFFGQIILHSTAWIVPVGRAVMEIATLPFAGAARSAGSRVLMAVMRRQRRRIMIRIIRVGGRSLAARVTRRIALKIIAFIGKVALDSTGRVARAVFVENQTNIIRGRINPTLVRELNLERIINESVRASVAEVFTGEIVSGIESIIPGSGTDLVPESVKQHMTTYISRQLLSTLLSPYTATLRAVLQSIPVPDSRETFTQNLNRNLQRELNLVYSTDTLTSMMGNICKRMFERPETIGF